MNPFIKRKLKKYEKATFNKQQHLSKYYLDKDDKAVIYIKINKIEDAFSEFCVPEHEELSADLAEYLNSIIYYIPLKYTVVLHFSIEHGTTEQKNVLKQVIIKYYGLILEDKKQDLKINLVIILCLFFIGVILLTLSYYLTSTNKGQLMTDIINIAGTFALWEVVDLYLLERKSKEIERYNAAQTAMAEIIFDN
ncbi:MAG: hypothetical protein AB9856_00210 [Cellulosilyticaceae bacterium]